MKKAIIEKNPYGYSVYIFDNDLPFIVIFVEDFEVTREAIEDWVSKREAEIEKSSGEEKEEGGEKE